MDTFHHAKAARQTKAICTVEHAGWSTPSRVLFDILACANKAFIFFADHYFDILSQTAIIKVGIH
jgi:hypothetical protein